MQKIIEMVYAVYGNELPTRLIYNAMTNKPLSVRGILKKFKRWERFVSAYAEHCVAVRKEKSDALVVIKPVVAKVTKQKSNEI